MLDFRLVVCLLSLSLAFLGDPSFVVDEGDYMKAVDIGVQQLKKGEQADIFVLRPEKVRGRKALQPLLSIDICHAIALPYRTAVPHVVCSYR